MTWFAIKYSGQEYVENLTGADEKTLVGLGFHGYATQAEAEARPDTANFAQMLIAAPILGGHPPISQTTVNPSNVASGAGAAAAAGLPGWRLIFGNTTGLLVRILKVGAGLILMIAGALRITGTDRRLASIVPVVGGPAGRLLSA